MSSFSDAENGLPDRRPPPRPSGHSGRAKRRARARLLVAEINGEPAREDGPIEKVSTRVQRDR